MKFLKPICFLALVVFSLGASSQTKTDSLSRSIKKQIIDSVSKAIAENYIFADTAKKMAAYIQSRFKGRAYDTIRHSTVFAKILTDDIRSVYHDGHLALVYSPKMTAMLEKTGGPTAEGQKYQREFGQSINFGFSRVEILEGNIGYIKLDGFWNVNEESKKTVLAVMQFVSHAKALVFDLRSNIGGGPDMVTYLAGFLFKDRTHLNDLYEGRSKTITPFWTSPDTSFNSLHTIPVIVLTAKKTFSAGEEFTYDLQTQKRAIIIGETTGGGAHPKLSFVACHGFIINIPIMRAINPITKTNWEAIGVKPDIEIPAEKALEEGLVKIHSLVKNDDRSK